jgi:hypothetical protein
MAATVDSTRASSCTGLRRSSGDPAGFPVITLEALVHMKLLSNRDKDRIHVRDLIGVGLVDRSWLVKLSPVLADRLQGILDTPDS